MNEEQRKSWEGFVKDVSADEFGTSIFLDYFTIDAIHAILAASAELTRLSSLEERCGDVEGLRALSQGGEMSAYKSLRHLIYINTPAQSRGEGYRLVKKLMEETREDCAKVAVEFVESENSKKYGWRSDEIYAAIRRKGDL